ncbi:MAG: YdcF family protein [Clostridia bacterium]|nr:YdcF family protein [Clostridia bacterium]
MFNIKEFKNRLWIQWVCYLLLLLTLFMILVLSAGIFMRASSDANIVTLDELAEMAGEQEFDCILVLGAGLRADGTPSPMLSDRVDTAVSIYNSGLCDKIIMSGDHTGSYNEVAAMKQQAMDASVAGRDVFLDHKGYSTYESVWRAKEVFGAKRILIVSQEYHLYRAVYIADQLGIEAVGVSSDCRVYAGSVGREAREVLARFKDMYLAARRAAPDTEVIPVSLDSNGNLT